MSATTAVDASAKARFESTMTFEQLRQTQVAFAAERGWGAAHAPRNLLLALSGEVGELSEIFQWRGDVQSVDDWAPEDKVHLGEELSDVMIYLIRLAAIRDKIVKNARKYPAPNQSLDVSVSEIDVQPPQVVEGFEPTMTLEGLRQQLAQFVADRNWQALHAPRNLLLALIGELGELCEIFQWKADARNVKEWPIEEQVHLGEELSDVAIYLIRLAAVMNFLGTGTMDDDAGRSTAATQTSMTIASSLQMQPTPSSPPPAAAVTPALDGTVHAPAAPPLFEEYYDDWASFDNAIASAIAKHHPIRKRSSLTFEVYNRTVSKGRHDRKSIAEFLSKTFKCTHGIKFRARGNGKRLRHKLRYIGCPFHVYASAVEFGATYRVRVRTHDKHNHVIGPDAIKNLQAFGDSEYDFTAGQDADPNAVTAAAVAAAASIVNAPTSVTNGQPLLLPAMMDVQTSAVIHATQAALQQMNSHDQHAHRAAVSASSSATSTPTDSASTQTNLLDTSEHDSEALLEGAIESSMGDFATSAVGTPTPRPSRFDPNMTLEQIRKSLAQFAAERDWDQFHTPRNLLLALTGEVGELCEIFQWKGEEKTVDDWTHEEKVHLGEELSDVMMYLVRLADKCNVDLPAAIQDKMVKNACKYPAELVKGSSKKYNEFKRMRLDKPSSL
ncbi:TPA: hypothetical protein N0F65_012656 [Lagenidium giganteum]|uniref:dCTP pyrophosphatase 1 n=1 Tax=Lagenidium giganteum TaxID=4803 RepID=A0AAV2YPB9_9STRA|nr:TPA: hypothetical protein N0F65_012656 [Lagenidium giganteum]